MIDKLMEGLPSWFGTAPQWVTLAVIIGALIKTWPVIMLRVTEAKSISWKQKREERHDLLEEIKGLKQEIADCKEKCHEDTQRLNEALFNQRKQNIQEQLSLISVIINSVDSPELRTLMKSLEAVQSTIALRAITEGAEDDGKEQTYVQGA